VNQLPRINPKSLFVIGMSALVISVSGLLSAQDMSGMDSRPESAAQSPIALDPASGSEVGFIYEAFLSPHQEGGEEEDTPALTPPQFKSTAPSVARAERSSRGHSVIEFSRDLSRATVFLAVGNVNPDDVAMLHLHCGRPGQLGPIIIDFSLAGSINSYLADGMLTIEVTNADIEGVLDHAHGLVGQFTSGCPIVPGTLDKVVTIAGMELIARSGELYFNLHTNGQIFYGDIRGQFHLVEEDGAQ